MSVLSVLHGQQRVRVGTIQPKEGMATNKGVISRVTKLGSVIIGSRRYRQHDGTIGKLSVTLTEARKHGYPNAVGSNRERTVYLSRQGETVFS